MSSISTLPRGGHVTLSGNTATFTDSAVTAKMHFFAKGLSVQKIPSEYSPCYNSKTPNDALRTRFSGGRDAQTITVIYGGETEPFGAFDVRSADVTEVDSGRKARRAQGVVIRTPEHVYTVCAAYEERTRPYVCNGITATGIISVFCDGERIFTKR